MREAYNGRQIASTATPVAPPSRERGNQSAADANGVGWEERDWARWTDDERTRFLGASTSARSARSRHRPQALAAVLVSLAASWLVWHLHASAPAAPVAPVVAAPSPIVYGTGLTTIAGGPTTCTEFSIAADGTQTCSAWTVVQPGQPVEAAAPLAAGAPCALARVDQERGSWVCLVR